ncbi:MAG: Lrp/AsnC family transcriptional regulator [Paracoccaceae bacterium]
MENLDTQDRRLLNILQRDGKISTQNLAEQASMSASPCWRRVQKLEKSGQIERYVALLNPNKLGLNARAYIHVSLLDHTEDSIRAFDNFVQNEAQIIECCSITGADDYLLKVVARDPEGLEQFIMKKILRQGIVRSSTTHFVLRQNKYSTALPLDI